MMSLVSSKMIAAHPFKIRESLKAEQDYLEDANSDHLARKKTEDYPSRRVEGTEPAVGTGMAPLMGLLQMGSRRALAS